MPSPDDPTRVRTVLLFGAPRCVPCTQAEAICNTLPPSLHFRKVNIDEEPGFAIRHKIKQIPTVIAFSDSTEVGRLGMPRNVRDILSLFEY